MDNKTLQQLFTYHPPHGRQVAVYEEIRRRGSDFAGYLFSHCPENFDRDAAIQKIREAVMLANSSIANEEVWRNQTGVV